MRLSPATGPEPAKGPGRPLAYAAAALLCVFAESVTAFDTFFQTPFYSENGWVISRSFHSEWKALLYTCPKVLIGTTGGVFLLVFLTSVFCRRRAEALADWKKPALLVALSIAIVPLAIAALKAVTGVYSPVDLLPYGGKHPYIGLVEQLWLHGQPAGGRSFPAGHASGGFALMALYYLPLTSFWKKSLLFAGFSAGWLMGLYQMGRGEHFMSHTLTTMFLALLIITSLARGLRLQ